MDIKQNKFAFFSNFAETIQALPSDKRAQAYQAICEYGIYGILPEDESLRMMCLMVKFSIFKENKRGGTRPGAGAPKNNQNAAKQSKTIKNNQNNQNNQSFLETETETETETKEKVVKKKKTMVSVEDVNLGEYEIIRPQVKKWLDYKKTEKNEGYKTAATLIICAKKLYEMSNGDPLKANDIIENSMANGYKGFVAPRTGFQSNSPRMSFKEMKEMQKEIEIQKVLRGEL